MAFVNPESKLYENQFDVLATDTASNPYMTYSKRAASNKALNTTKKNIVGAINELANAQAGLEGATAAAVGKMNNVIGDHSANVSLKDSFQATGYSNLTEAVVGLVEEQKETVQNVKDLVSKVTKEVVFVYPKITQSAVSIEQFVPLKGRIVQVIARVAPENNLGSSNINLVLQKGPHGTSLFDNVQNIILNSTDTYKEYDFSSAPVSIDNEVLKTSLITYPNLVKNLVVIAKIELVA